MPQPIAQRRLLARSYGNVQSVVVQTGAFDDDAAQSSDTTVNTGGTNTTLAGTVDWFGARPASPGIPRGSVILSATVEVSLTSTSFDDPDAVAYVTLENSAAFVASNNNISNRPRSNLSVVWSGTGIGTGWMTVGDLGLALQQWVNRTTYAATDRFAVVLQRQGSCNVRFRNHDAGTGEGLRVTIRYRAPLG